MDRNRRGLEYLREKLGESQTETARALGLNYKTYNHFEHRRRRPRDLGTLLRMAEHFGVSVEEIIWHLGSNAESEQVSVRTIHTA